MDNYHIDGVLSYDEQIIAEKLGLQDEVNTNLQITILKNELSKSKKQLEAARERFVPKREISMPTTTPTPTQQRPCRCSQSHEQDADTYNSDPSSDKSNEPYSELFGIPTNKLLFFIFILIGVYCVMQYFSARESHEDSEVQALRAMVCSLLKQQANQSNPSQPSPNQNTTSPSPVPSQPIPA